MSKDGFISSYYDKENNIIYGSAFFVIESLEKIGEVLNLQINYYVNHHFYCIDADPVGSFSLSIDSTIPNFSEYFEEGFDRISSRNLKKSCRDYVKDLVFERNRARLLEKKKEFGTTQ